MTTNPVHIGLSGYSYKPWQGAGRFYPEKLKSAEFLRYYAGGFNTVELDGMWYRLPTEQPVQGWLEQTPASFIFSPKAHRQITHMHRLKPDALAFVETGVRARCQAPCPHSNLRSADALVLPKTYLRAYSKRNQQQKGGFMMVHVIMYHSVSRCFGTSLAPRLHSMRPCSGSFVMGSGESVRAGCRELF